MKRLHTIIVLLLIISIELWLIANVRQTERDQICSMKDVVCPWEEKEEEATKRAGIVGVASWYDYTLDSGWSSVGHRVCASRDFPRKSYLLVQDLSTGKLTTCTVTDYIEHPDRIIDLSSTAFSDLKPLKYGLIHNVSVQLLW